MKFIDYLYQKVSFHPLQSYALFYYQEGDIFEKCIGNLSDEFSDKITFNSNFRLASVTKQFIAFGIVKLINNGLLAYETSVLDIYPDLPLYFKDITIKQLLNHTSGIMDYENMEHTDKQISDEDILIFLKNTNKTYFTPGERYQYSNTAYILLGLIISKVSNRKLDEYIKTEIFDKANMDKSIVNYEGKTDVFERAYGHIIDNEKLIVKDQYWCSATIGDGGIYSSINDLKKWIKYLVTTNEFLDMKKPNIAGNYNEYGLGLRIINVNESEIIYHSGSTIGTKTLLLFSSDLKICLLFLTNLNDFNGTTLKEVLVEYLEKEHSL
jgi:CubicO group peptidase (beta-lactamase class C family)